VTPFHPFFRNPHAQTIAGHLWKRPAIDPRFPTEHRLFRTEPDVQVLVESNEPGGGRAGDVVLVHGLEGSGHSGYMLGLSVAALRAGFAAHRFNMRTCGGTERLCGTLYHAGLTSDLRTVLSRLRDEGRSPVFLVGFSLGGNVVLKLAGEMGASARNLFRGVCAVSTPLDLEACARHMAKPRNRFYEQRFARRMRARLCATGRYKERQFAGLRSIMAIDDRITAPSFGFSGASHYYRTQSAVGHLDAIRVPVLLLQSKDDTFIPFEVFDSPAVRSNPWIALVATDHGGHLGFIARKPRRFWAEETIMEWIVEQNVRQSRIALSS
jgi:predicted alpha/beta-fold hydrolase